VKRGVVGRYEGKIKRQKLATKGIIITALIITIIIALSYYGQHVGNFIINVDKGSFLKGLSLCSAVPDPETKIGFTSMLSTTPLENAIETQISDIPGFEDVDDPEWTFNINNSIAVGDGVKNDPQARYLAYSFYLINSGKEVVNYTASMMIDRVTRSIDETLRVLIIREIDKQVDWKVYAKPQNGGVEDGFPEKIIAPDGITSLGDTVPFERRLQDDGTTKYYAFYDENNKDFQKDNIVRYTTVIWLDGWDYQSSVTMVGGAIKMSMDFTVNK
jgi:hypothetical protein